MCTCVKNLICTCAGTAQIPIVCQWSSCCACCAAAVDVESILKLDFHDVTFISQVVQLCDVHVLVLAAQVVLRLSCIWQ